MEVKTLRLEDGRTLRFGRRKPPARMPIMSLSRYLDLKALPTPPAQVDYTTAASASLSHMYLNDQLGDCVIAGVSHAVGVMTANEPEPTAVLADSQVQDIYSAACGYVPGKPATDQGCDIQAVLAYWQKNGVPIGSGHKIAGWVAVDPANKAEMMVALWLFENLLPGIDLPDAWVNPAPSASGFVWDVAGAPDPNNGHCPPFFGYDASGVRTSTWGMVGTTTWAAVAKYCAASAQGELYTVISQDVISAATLLAPTGLNWTQMVADFNAMGGNVTPPTPVPPPTPNPPSPPTPPAPPSPPTPPTPPAPHLIEVEGHLVSTRPISHGQRLYTLQGTVVSEMPIPHGKGMI